MDNQSINPGENWKSFYIENNLTWENKAYYTEANIKLYLNSDWIRTILSGTKPGLKILEAGCGTGLFSIALSYSGYDVTSIDYNHEAVELAKENLALFNSQSSHKLKVEFLRADLLNLKFDNNSFDLVFNQAVLEYFIDDTDLNNAISEMTRVTKLGGKVIAIVQNTGNPLHSFWNLLGIGGYINQPKVRKINRKILLEYFRKANLKDISVDGLYPWKSIFKAPEIMKRFIYYPYRFCEKFVPLPKFIRSGIGIQLVIKGTKK